MWMIQQTLLCAQKDLFLGGSKNSYFPWQMTANSWYVKLALFIFTGSNILFSLFFCPFVPYCSTSTVSSTPSKSRSLLVCVNLMSVISLVQGIRSDDIDVACFVYLLDRF